MAKVLIVDDAAFMRMMIKDVVIKLGHEVLGEAVDGDDAVKQCKHATPDLITMDITMPNKDGIQAVKEIRSLGNTSKIIMVSAMGQQAMVVEAIQSGANDFLVKPFTQDKIAERIVAVMKK